MNKQSISMNIKEKAAAWIMAKGLGVTVLVAYCIITSMTIKTLYERINQIQNQMFQLQNTVINDNTKAMQEFNLLKTQASKTN